MTVSLQLLTNVFSVHALYSENPDDPRAWLILSRLLDRAVPVLHNASRLIVTGFIFLALNCHQL
jgi:hypothetical protein